MILSDTEWYWVIQNDTEIQLHERTPSLLTVLHLRLYLSWLTLVDSIMYRVLKYYESNITTRTNMEITLLCLNESCHLRQFLCSCCKALLLCYRVWKLVTDPTESLSLSPETHQQVCNKAQTCDSLLINHCAVCIGIDNEGCILANARNALIHVELVGHLAWLHFVLLLTPIHWFYEATIFTLFFYSISVLIHPCLRYTR